MDSLSVIDVGCGNSPKGDVNVDLFIDGRHRATKDRINAVRIPNFVKADSLHLPFRDKVFQIAVSNHTIEHTDSPYQFLEELQRVAEKIEMNVPLGCAMDWLWFRVHGHKWSLFQWWYRKALPNAKVNVRLTFNKILVRGKPIPVVRNPYVEIHVVTN